MAESLSPNTDPYFNIDTFEQLYDTLATQGSKHGHIVDEVGSRCVVVAADTVAVNRNRLERFIAGKTPAQRIWYVSSDTAHGGEGLPLHVVSMYLSVAVPTMDKGWVSGLEPPCNAAAEGGERLEAWLDSLAAVPLTPIRGIIFGIVPSEEQNEIFRKVVRDYRAIANQ